MVTIAIIPYWGDSFIVLHTFLYIISFAQMLLPISITAKGVLWTVLFGLAKTCQYGGLTILGVEGYKRLKSKVKGQKSKVNKWNTCHKKATTSS